MSQVLAALLGRRRESSASPADSPVDRGPPCSAAYCLPDAALEYLTRQLLLDTPPSDARFCCYRLSGDNPYSDIARTVECRVFEHFFGNSPDVMADQYGPYESQSSFLLVVDCRAQRPAGALRMISSSPHRGLKTLDDIVHAPLFLPTSEVVAHHGIDDLSRCWDVGSVAVLREYRGQTFDHLISTTLYGRLHMQAAASGIEHFTAILDSHAFDQLVRVFGVPFMPIMRSRPFEYLGSQTNIAAYCHVPSIPPMMTAHLNKLEVNFARSVRPYVMRLAYGEGIPEIVGTDQR